jgi:Fe-S cluster biogenesis protein NfuA
MVQQSLSSRLRRSFRVRAERVLDRMGLVEPRPAAAVVWDPPAAATPEAPPAPKAVPAPKESSAPAGGMTFEAVQEVFDDMVRPALQADGGDITLHEVVGGEVRVSLVGACNTCPSSTVTMKLGVERLLQDEFEDFVALVQVGG